MAEVIKEDKKAQTWKSVASTTFSQWFRLVYNRLLKQLLAFNFFWDSKDFDNMRFKAESSSKTLQGNATFPYSSPKSFSKPSLSTTWATRLNTLSFDDQYMNQWNPSELVGGLRVLLERPVVCSSEPGFREVLHENVAQGIHFDSLIDEDKWSLAGIRRGSPRPRPWKKSLIGLVDRFVIKNSEILKRALKKVYYNFDVACLSTSVADFYKQLYACVTEVMVKFLKFWILVLSSSNWINFNWFYRKKIMTMWTSPAPCESN